jgi:hypothetical protein
MELGTNMYLLKPLNVADVMNILVGMRRYWRPVERPEGLPERRPTPLPKRSTTWTTPRAA